jgi:hypothetical protein
MSASCEARFRRAGRFGEVGNATTYGCCGPIARPNLRQLGPDLRQMLGSRLAATDFSGPWDALALPSGVRSTAASGSALPPVLPVSVAGGGK